MRKKLTSVAEKLRHISKTIENNSVIVREFFGKISNTLTCWSYDATLMSSPKDFVLKITPPLDGDTQPLTSRDVLKFSVKHRVPPLIYRARCWLLCGSIFGIVIYGAYNYESITSFQNLAVLLIQALIVLLLCVIQEPCDTLTIMKGIGAQLESNKTLSFQSTNTFIPISNIIDLVIHEGFHNYGQVIFYMCFLTKGFRLEKPGKDDVIQVVFGEFLPRKDVLLTVWKLSRQLLFGETRRYWRRVPGQGLKEISKFTE